MANDLIYPMANAGGDYDVDGKKHRESMVSSLMKQFREDNFVVEGLEVTDVGGLDVEISPGEANIEGRRIVINTVQTVTLTDDTTNYIYLKLEYDSLGNVSGINVAVNETGIKPDKSLYLANVEAINGVLDYVIDERKNHYVKNAVNADNADNAIISEKTKYDKVFPLSGNAPIELGPLSPGDYSIYLQNCTIRLEDGEKLVLRRAKWRFLPYSSESGIILMYNGSMTWEEKLVSTLDREINTVIYENTSGSFDLLDVAVRAYHNDLGSGDVNIDPGAGWSFVFSIEQI